MFRSRTTKIDFRYPRSSGGKFFSNRIDETRSGLSITYELVTIFGPQPPPTSDIWGWNSRDLTEFNLGTPVYIGNTTGSTTLRINSGSAAGRTIPSLDWSFSSNFQTPNSAGLALFPIEPNRPLPRRFQLDIAFSVYSAGGGTPFIGFYFNSNQFTGSLTSSLYGSAIAFGTNISADARSMNFTTGSLGLWGIQNTQTLGYGQNVVLNFKLLVESNSLTGTAAGPIWKVTSIGGAAQSANTMNSNFYNQTSGSNSTWIGAGNLDRMGILVGRTQSGSVATNMNDLVSIKHITIMKHPGDI
jgi:hypothetical protein